MNIHTSRKALDLSSAFLSVRPAWAVCGDAVKASDINNAIRTAYDVAYML
ncbi:hypothetical protein [Pelotomaculum propionicicum]|nr:hypothetical protein [Pelotomaculum propionicicum]